MSTVPNADIIPIAKNAIARKLAAVMGEISRVRKSGRNQFHKYDYATESDVTDAIRGKLAEQGVAFFPSVSEHVVEVVTDARNRQTYHATVTLEVRFVDGESGQELVSRWVGIGEDGGDKAYYKAYTGAIKYALMKTFMVSTGDDPEQDEPPRRQPARRHERSKKNTDPASDFSRMADQADAEERAKLEAELEQGPLSDDEKRTELLAKINTFITEAEANGLEAGHGGLWAVWVCQKLGVETLAQSELAMLDGIYRKLRGMGHQGRIAKMRECAEEIDAANKSAAPKLLDPAVAYELEQYKRHIKEALDEGATMDQAAALAVHIGELFEVGSLAELDGAQFKHINGKLAAMLPNERAGYMLRVTEGVPDDVTLPLPEHDEKAAHDKARKAFFAASQEPFNKGSFGQKGTAEDYRQALMRQWSSQSPAPITSFGDADAAAIANAANALRAIEDLSERNVFMAELIKAWPAAMGEGE